MCPLKLRVKLKHFTYAVYWIGSNRRINAHQAEEWWQDHEDRVLKKNSLARTRASSSAPPADPVTWLNFVLKTSELREQCVRECWGEGLSWNGVRRWSKKRAFGFGGKHCALHSVSKRTTGMGNTLAEYMILFGADNRPPMLDKDSEGVTRTKKYVELSAAKKIQANCDMKETNIILQGLPADIYSLVNHQSCQIFMGESLITDARVS
nr:hypothetical protein CTI12_AA424350 [Tanacetum cinerariifolium]